MLTTKLSRAQLELQAHRTWLRTFSVGRNTTASFSTATASFANTTTPARRPDPKKAAHRNKMIALSQRFKDRTDHKLSEADRQLVALQRQISDASKDFDFDAAMAAYRAIENKKLIIHPVFITLTSQMAFWARLQAAKNDQDAAIGEKLVPIAEELIEDIMKGALGPRPEAFAFLLNYFVATRSWETGLRFWKWLEDKEDHWINADVYGAAIQLHAAQDTSLEDLETLYQQGLSRFSDSFAAYHFSPGAIVPDREQKLTLPGLPLGLLYGIMSARLMRGDAQNAYLSLDSALRLRPVALESEFYIEYQRERPVPEAYTIFAMACKSGKVLPNSAYRALLASLRENADTKDPRRFVLTVRAMLSATYLQLGGGGKLTRNAITEIIIVLTNMARIKGVAEMSHEDKMQLGEAIQELIRKTLELATRFSSVPTIAAFNTIIFNIAGLGNAEKTITTAMQDVYALGLTSTSVTRRSILVAAGSAGDAELITKAWKWLVQARTKEGQTPDTTDLHILVRACVLADYDSFAKETINNIPHLEEWRRTNCLERLEKRTDAPPKNTHGPADLQLLLSEIAKIKADLEVFDERTSDARGVQDFSAQHVPMLVFSPPKDVRLPEKEMRKLYDELTTDQAAAPAEAFDAANAHTQPNTQGELGTGNGAPEVARWTNVPLSELRYESWKLITYLLAEADRHDKAYIRAVDAAIAKGERPPQRNYGELFEGAEKIEGVGLSDPPQELVKEGEEVDVEKVRERIMELRKFGVVKE